MSEVSWYLGFGASETLYQMNNDFRASLSSSNDKVQREKLFELVSQFADECLNQYFVTPVDQVKMNNMGRKVVNGGVSAMRKTINVTLKQVIKKLDANDRKKLADHINGLLLPLRESKRYPIYVAVAIDDELRYRLGAAVEQGKANGASTISKQYSEALCELVDIALDSYMHKPLGMMNLGRVMGKVTSVATDGVRGAAQTVVKKVIPSMSDKEMIGFFEFSESILYAHPVQA
ncbi:hypothetical protein FT643_19835 [Ketobacter sp. MCCC 1A13808]|uniref:hypothetical protein n=1 Tax=Ketobacter sp. MCCC 1A13808 TaxID=2602738 RepID=UPI000F241FD8|nr:hypothetical protein [Ketobacter sp. MCCC 1A13808]MVF14392.1 hypothetical protein [Ketobacter sp. MCCC 1A13808]RLP54380.1 MAG: hypothetical protein D6160_10090 [Ketobacter sp.]